MGSLDRRLGELEEQLSTLEDSHAGSLRSAFLGRLSDEELNWLTSSQDEAKFQRRGKRIWKWYEEVMQREPWDGATSRRERKDLSDDYEGGNNG